MKFETIGNRNNPAILMIHALSCDSSACIPFAQPLQDEYYIILPTLDAHYTNSDRLHSANQQADKIVKYLHNEKITSLALLHGTSMGAKVALAVAARCDIPVEHYFYDGGPFFRFPKLLKFIMFKNFQGIINKCKGRTVDELMKDRFVKRLDGGNSKQYRELLGRISKMADYVLKDDIKAIVEICYNGKLPDFPEETEKKFIFFFSKREPAHMAKRKLMKKYSGSTYIDWPGNVHCGYQTSNPIAYANYLRTCIKQ